MATLDAHLAISLVLGMTGIALTLLVALAVVAWAVYHNDRE
jgi:hypothetical protein